MIKESEANDLNDQTATRSQEPARQDSGITTRNKKSGNQLEGKSDSKTKKADLKSQLRTIKTNKEDSIAGLLTGS